MAADEEHMDEQLLGGRTSIERKKAWWKMLSEGKKYLGQNKEKYAEYEKALRSKGEIAWDNAATALGYLSYAAYLIPGLQAVKPVGTAFGTIKTAKDFRKLAKTIKNDDSRPLLLTGKLRELVGKLEEFQRENYGQRDGNPEINDLIRGIEAYIDVLEPGWGDGDYLG